MRLHEIRDLLDHRRMVLRAVEEDRASLPSLPVDKPANDGGPLDRSKIGGLYLHGARFAAGRARMTAFQAFVLVVVAAISLAVVIFVAEITDDGLDQ